LDRIDDLEKSHRNDGFVKGPNGLFPVIPMETGIQSFQYLANTLDSRLRGNDNYLQTIRIGKGNDCLPVSGLLP
jgi:hypothetical protein